MAGLKNTFKVASLMSYRVWEPVPPNGNLQLLTNQERKISTGVGVQKAVWNLDEIQHSLSREPPLTVVYSTSAQQSMSDTLGWNGSDMCKFICQLTRGRYEGSRWCYAPKGSTPHAADVYRMGYSRVQGRENQRLSPWTYVKFSVVGSNLDKLFIFSAHPEGQFEGE
ncbi:hypothetical protein [Polaromonas sp.]|uniref:hypothetical protein n=1 Tax=Polaromonas sp. TaxID=1869339 RepID=UPI003565BCAF